jgi:hypothetical protein
MNDLNALLDRAAGPTTAPVDIYADLARGHRALSRTRRRRGALGLAGVAVAGVAGFGLSRYVQAEPEVYAHDAGQHGSAGISFLAQPFKAGPYTFDQTPQGWEVQGSNPTAVTIAPVGFADQNPLSFVGKLVILLDGNPPHGEQVVVDGRTFWVDASGGGDSTTIGTATRDDEPPGTVSIQYPSNAGWTRATMLTFLGSVHVGPGAQQGLG